MYLQYCAAMLILIRIEIRAVDPRSFFADPDLAVFLNADQELDAVPDPALQNCSMTLTL